MSRPLLLTALLALAFVAGGLWSTRTGAQDATPGSMAGGSTLILAEHNDAMTDRFGDDGPSPGDIRVWGPNALYDETNTTDTGITTQGSCIGLNTNFDCLANETIVFPDGSTLEIQGIQAGAAPSTRTIVGSSGQYLGGDRDCRRAPPEDLALWTKTIEISGLGEQ